MKTSKRGRGGILTEKMPMKIYWKYGKEIDVLLYIDRIIFIKIHIHVQELAWSRVLCHSAPWGRRAAEPAQAAARVPSDTGGGLAGRTGRVGTARRCPTALGATAGWEEPHEDEVAPGWVSPGQG